jgi:hypothetical protein
LWVIFALLDPDPDPDSGSATLPRTREPLCLKIMSGVPARMEGLADRHQGVREGCTGGGADLRTVLPPGAIEYRAVSGVFQNSEPLTLLSTQRVCPPPCKGGGYTGVHTRRAVGGQYFWKMPDIGLASYSIISLRALPMDKIST